MTRADSAPPARIRIGRALLRRGWLVLLTAIVAGVSADAVTRLYHRSYTAEAVVVVPSGAHRGTPGNATDAGRLATTYAALIPSDQRLLSAVASAVGQPVTAVQRAISVTNDTGTALLRLDYKASSADLATRGVDALTEDLTRVRTSRNVPIGSLSLVKVPDPPTASASSAPAIAAGALLGLCLGIMLLIAFERADPRLDSADALDAVLDCPRSALDGLPERSVATLLTRWQELAPGQPARVAVLPSSGPPQKLAEPVALRLAAAGREWGLDVAVRTVSDEHPVSRFNNGHGVHESGGPTPDIVLLVGSAPESPGAGEAVALSSDIAVLVAQPSSKARELAKAADVLARYGVVPSWAVLASRRRTLRALKSRPVLDTVPEPV